MNKMLKRITAAAIAAVLAVGTMGTVGSAAITPVPLSEDTWAVMYYNHPGTGTYTGDKDYCYMTYSAKGNLAACKKMECTVEGASGSVGVSAHSSNITAVHGTLTYVGDTVTLKPEALSEVRGISYEFYGSTGVVTNKITANGTIRTRK